MIPKSPSASLLTTARPIRQPLGRPPGRRPVLCGWGLALLVVLMASPAGAQVSGSLQAKQKQLKQIQLETEQIKKQLENSSTFEKEALEEIRELEARLRSIKRHEQELLEKKDRQANAQKELRNRIRFLKAEKKRTENRITLHLKSIFRFSKKGDSATLLTLARYGDFFKNSHYISVMVEKNRKNIERYQKLDLELTEKKKEVDQILYHLVELSQQVSEERKNLQAGQKELKESLGNIRKNRSVYQNYLKDLAKMQNGMRDTLVNLEKKTAAAENQNLRPSQLKGKLPAPTPGTIVASFGESDPRYNLKKFQRGVVIRVADSAPVLAVASGSVVHAGPFRGYQQLVVLEHGEGLYSVYGYLEKLAIQKGAFVTQGQKIGQAAYQPVDSHYNLYFEIRLKGKPVDPTNWIQKGALKNNGSGQVDP